MKQRISILGSGWLGVPVAKTLLESASNINISTRQTEKVKSLARLGLQPFIIDIDNLAENIDAFLDCDILLVNITSKNISAFEKLVDKIQLSSIKQVLFISSTGVYPNQDKLCKESDDLEKVQHPLLTIESLFINNQHFQTTVIRFAGLIGGARHPGRFFATSKVPKKIIAAPQAAVNLIHLDDCIAIIDNIIKHGIWGEVFNACADTHPSKALFYTHNALQLGLQQPRLNNESSLANKVICNAKLKKMLNYRFIHSDLMKIDAIKDYANQVKE